MLAGAMFQKPSVRLLAKRVACSRLSARTCVSGTGRHARQLAQNLFLKCSFPGTKWGGHAPLLKCAPQQAETPGWAPLLVPVDMLTVGVGLWPTGTNEEADFLRDDLVRFSFGTTWLPAEGARPRSQAASLSRDCSFPGRHSAPAK